MQPQVQSPATDDAKFNDILSRYNYTPPATPSSQASGGSQDWYSFVKSSAKSAQPKEQVPSPAATAAANTVNDYTQAPAKLLTEAGRSDESTNENPIIRTGENALAATASGIGTVFSPITNAVKSAADSFAQGAKDPMNHNQPLYKNPIVGKILDFFSGASGGLDKFSTDHPEAARNLNNLLTVGLTAAGESTSFGEKPIGSIEGIKDTAKSAFEAAGKGAETAIDAGDAAGKAVAKTSKTLADKATGAFKGKTVDEILSTPEDKLHKLSAGDRQTYFDIKKADLKESHDAEQEAIAQKSDVMEKQIKDESDKNIADLQSKTQDLKNKADRASLEEAQNLKPKVIQSMRDNSAKYRELVDKEISQHSATPVKADELKQFVQDKFLEDPNRISAITEKLGLSGDSKIPDTTIGKIYEHTKTLRQDIGSSAKKGNRTFTPDEKLIDDAVSILSDFMKSKGVDLAEANRFWSKYALLRDKMIKNIEPFTPRGSEKPAFNTFSKKIQKSIQGVDEGNKDFIGAIEDLLDVKIGNSEVRTALEKLDANQKSQVAEAIDAHDKLQENKASEKKQSAEAESKKTAAEKDLDAKKFEADRKAKTRKNILSAVAAVGITGTALETLKKLLGF